MSWSGCEVDNLFTNDLKNGKELVLYCEVAARLIMELLYQCQVLDASPVIMIPEQAFLVVCGDIALR